MQRYSLKPFQFSNGAVVPQGTLIACVAQAMHEDDQYRYKEPADGGASLRDFHPWRNLSGEYAGQVSEVGAVKRRLGTTAATTINFGHGRHAWCVE